MSCSSSSPVPSCPEDTFTSISEGQEEETSWQYGDDSFESYSSGEASECPAVLDFSESAAQLSSQDSEAKHEPDALDSAAVTEGLTRKWISLLKDIEARTELIKSAPDSDKAIESPVKVSDEELGALQSFCTVKMRQLRHLPCAVPLKRNKNKNQRPGLTSKKPSSCVVPDPLVNRLYLQNVKETLKQLAEAKVHQPSRCPHCLKKMEELAEASFLRRKKTLVEGILLQEKLEEHLYCRDSLTLIGEIHRGLPRLFEDPKNIWQELNMKSLKI